MINILNILVFDVRDYDETSDFYGSTNVQTCLYQGRRYPPNHPRKYQHSKEYWHTLCNQLISVIVLEVSS